MWSDISVRSDAPCVGWHTRLWTDNSTWSDTSIWSHTLTYEASDTPVCIVSDTLLYGTIPWYTEGMTRQYMEWYTVILSESHQYMDCHNSIRCATPVYSVTRQYMGWHISIMEWNISIMEWHICIMEWHISIMDLNISIMVWNISIRGDILVKRASPVHDMSHRYSEWHKIICVYGEI